MPHTVPAPASASSVQLILAAASFASEKHARQKRKGVEGAPYIGHLLEVAELVAGSGETLDTNLIVAALLHDTVEDTATTIHELREKFGEDVASLVAEVTDDKSLPKATRKALQVRNAPHKSARAATIKLADKTSNLRAILTSPPADWSFHRKREYFEWAKQVAYIGRHVCRTGVITYQYSSRTGSVLLPCHSPGYLVRHCGPQWRPSSRSAF
jgi:guanosine-3',5'-bis(diphosphate) 3'-pyrophosphohydrolase